MNRDRLIDRLEALETDGYLLDAAQDDANQLYLSGFTGPDPFVTLYADGTVHLLVSGLEYGRARAESAADTVKRHADYDYEHGDSADRYDMYAAFIREHGVDAVSMPPRAPVGTADALRDRGIEVVVDEEDVLGGVRAVKTDEEVQAIRDAQRANEAAMEAAEAMLRAATIAGSADSAETGVLLHDGDPLTSERVAQEIEITLLQHGCALDETIVAGGAQAADPHDRGSGPLHAHETIIIDIFPRSKETKYNGDMTRTFCVGKPSAKLQEWYELTERAFQAALDAIEPGVTGEAVHNAACAVFESAGEPTFRTEPTTETGFIHSTGHGIGLAVHEEPRLASGGSTLEPGHVVTVEPGLYDPEVGGVRIEDLVVVTEDGYENLTTYPVEFTVG